MDLTQSYFGTSCNSNNYASKMRTIFFITEYDNGSAFIIVKSCVQMNIDILVIHLIQKVWIKNKEGNLHQYILSTLPYPIFT